MKNKNYLLVLLAVICIGFAVAIYVGSTRQKLSLADLQADSERHLIFSDGVAMAREFAGTSKSDPELKLSTSFAQAREQADTVVLATYSGEGDFTDIAIYYNLKVDKVIKGEVESELITLINRVRINDDFGEKKFYQDESIGPLKKGEQYLLCLKPLQNTYNLILPDNMHAPYLLNTGSVFDFYQLSGEAQVSTYDEKKGGR